MIKWKVILFAFVLVGMFACGEEPKKQKAKGSDFKRDEVTKLEDEVMRIHDEVMPKTSEMQRLRREINEKLENSESYNEQFTKELRTALDGLERADKAMWDWMYTYNVDSISNKTEKKLYLVDERAEIKRVARMMVNSIEYAKETLRHEPAE